MIFVFVVVVVDHILLELAVELKFPLVEVKVLGATAAKDGLYHAFSLVMG